MREISKTWVIFSCFTIFNHRSFVVLFLLHSLKWELFSRFITFHFPLLAPLSILLDNLTCSFCFLISNAREHLHSVFLPPSPDRTTHPQIMELTETITFRTHQGQYSSSSFYHTSFVSTVSPRMQCAVIILPPLFLDYYFLRVFPIWVA